MGGKPVQSQQEQFLFLNRPYRRSRCMQTCLLSQSLRQCRRYKSDYNIIKHIKQSQKYKHNSIILQVYKTPQKEYYYKGPTKVGINCTSIPKGEQNARLSQ